METFPMGTGEVQTGATEQESFSLPSEIWTKILERVERTNDLLACRQVNRQWHSITTDICRHRFLRLNLFQRLENPENKLASFCSTFKDKDCDNLPWSACELHFDMLPPGVHHFSLVSEFMCLVGSHIRELTVSGDDSDTNDGILSIMNGVPNIEYLDISWIRIKEPIQESFTTQLGRLKGLIAYIHNCSSFHLFQLLLNRPEVQLRSLQLTIISDNWLTERCEDLATLIAAIPVLHLDLNRFLPEEFIHLTSKRVQVRQLHLDAPRVPGIPGFHSSLVAFLKNTAESLQKLILYDNPSPASGREDSRLIIPMLPQLTYLEVYAGTTREYPSLSNVIPFTSDQFPKLTSVNGQGYFPNFMARFDLKRGPFDTVTQLKLSDTDPLRQTQNENPLERNWDKMFPNLKELDAHVTCSGLRLILTKFRLSLERLILVVQSRPCEKLGDLSTILTGGRQFGNEKQGESGSASILSLPRLKDFKLLVYPQQHTMGDAFVDSCLLQIQPLDNLCLDNVLISEEYKVKLQKYHRKVEIYGEFQIRCGYTAPSKFHRLH